MRKLNFFLLSLLFFALTFSSCKKHDDDKTDSEKTAIENNSGNSEVTSEKVTVIFNTDGAGTVEPQTVEKGTKITLPLGESMKKDGYKFLGWSLTENGEIITEYTVNENKVTLFAVWVKAFTVKFDTDGGTGKFASQTIEKGKTATKPESKPEKENYVFMGWYDGDTKFDFSTSITTEITLKAKYEYAKFSVNAEGKQVAFSSGNLQKVGSQYQFAASQTEYVGAESGEKIDLFQWADNFDTYINGWRVLTDAEWKYLIGVGDSKRESATTLRKWTTIDGVNGLVILPDECTASISDDWATLEAAGAVFLPCKTYGFYWSSSPVGSGTAWCLLFYSSGGVYVNSDYSRGNRMAVRLVRSL